MNFCLKKFSCLLKLFCIVEQLRKKQYIRRSVSLLIAPPQNYPPWYWFTLTHTHYHKKKCTLTGNQQYKHISFIVVILEIFQNKTPSKPPARNPMMRSGKDNKLYHSSRTFTSFSHQPNSVSLQDLSHYMSSLAVPAVPKAMACALSPFLTQVV